MELIIAKLSSLSGWIFGAFGSALALFFGRKSMADMKRWEIAFIWVAGVFISHIVGGAIVEYYDITLSSFIADTIKMTMGMVGMGALAKLHERIPQIVDKIINRD
jgi:membrane associated rhomboid family serine protease